jgi:hypothetical protein
LVHGAGPLDTVRRRFLLISLPLSQIDVKVDAKNPVWHCVGMDSAKYKHKLRLSRLRLTAERQGLRLTHSRRRDVRALDYGLTELIGEYGDVVYSSKSMDDIERWLTGEVRSSDG